MKWTALAVAALLLTTVACSHGKAPATNSTGNAQPPAPTPTPAATPAPAEQLAAGLFPAQDKLLQYSIWEGAVSTIILEGPEAVPPTHVAEDLIRDGSRLVVTQNGKVYATWHINQDGVWRTDPKGGGALLRYLPPTLKDGAAWRQKSGDAEVWFKLQYGPTGCRYTQNPIQCWSVTVLNRGELITFGFDADTGPTGIRSLSLAKLTDSYQKHLGGQSGSTLTAEQRTAYLKQGEAAPTGSLPAVTTVTAEDFDRTAGAARLAARPALPVRKVDADGDGQEELLQGAIGEWSREPVWLFSADKRFLVEKHRGSTPGFRLEPVTFPGVKQTLFLVEWGEASGSHHVELDRFTPGTPNMFLPLRGWDQVVSASAPEPSLGGTGADRVQVHDGVIAVESKSEGVREYKVVEINGSLWVQPASSQK